MFVPRARFGMRSDTPGCHQSGFCMGSGGSCKSLQRPHRRSPVQVAITSRGRRADSYRQFLQPVLSRPNLTVATRAQVSKVAFETRDGTPTAVGVNIQSINVRPPLASAASLLSHRAPLPPPPPLPSLSCGDRRSHPEGVVRYRALHVSCARVCVCRFFRLFGGTAASHSTGRTMRCRPSQAHGFRRSGVSGEECVQAAHSTPCMICIPTSHLQPRLLAERAHTRTLTETTPRALTVRVWRAVRHLLNMSSGGARGMSS